MACAPLGDNEAVAILGAGARILPLPPGDAELCPPRVIPKWAAGDVAGVFAELDAVVTC